MTNRVQEFRSNTAGVRPSGALPGTLYVNWADGQFGAINSGAATQDLIAVRYFSNRAVYVAGDHVIQGGLIYRAIGAVPAGAFNPTQWVSYLSLAGGTLTGPLILAADPTVALGAATKQYVDAKVPAGGYLPLSGGVMTGAITLVPGNTVTGAAATRRSTFGATAASLRWELDLGDAQGESGSNAGSDFALVNYSDAGAILSQAVQVKRASGAMVLNGIGASPFSSVLAPGACNLVLNKAAGITCNLNGASNGVLRWAMSIGDNTAEGGSNSGSDFTLRNCTDAGVLVGTCFSVQRASGAVFINGNGATPNASAFSTSAANLSINKAGSGFLANLNGMSNGLLRWQIALGNATAESGSNNGSGFAISRFSDAGAVIDQPLQIARASGATTFSVAIINGPSDRTLKENITPIEDALDKVLALQGVNYNFIATPDKPEMA